MSIIRFLEGAVFDTDATKAMSDAFDAACKELHDTGQPELMREVIARRIIEIAKDGERDPARLRAAALDRLGLTRSSG